MPVPVVPIFAPPVARSLAESSRRCVGRMRWALRDILRRFFRSVPEASRARASSVKSTGSSTTPLPMMLVCPCWKIPEGIERSTYFLPSNSRVWPALGYGVVTRGEHVNYFSFTLVAPLEAEQYVNFHDCGKVNYV